MWYSFHYIDLQIKLGDTRVKIRVAGFMKTPRGYLFEKSEQGYIFPLSGKIMTGETSEEAMVRETKEEIGIDVQQLTLRALLENFYETGSEKVHELCFVYEIGDVFTGVIPQEFVEVLIDEADGYTMRPTGIVDVLKSKDAFKHVVIR